MHPSPIHSEYCIISCQGMCRFGANRLACSEPNGCVSLRLIVWETLILECMYTDIHDHNKSKYLVI